MQLFEKCYTYSNQPSNTAREVALQRNDDLPVEILTLEQVKVTFVLRTWDLLWCKMRISWCSKDVILVPCAVCRTPVRAG